MAEMIRQAEAAQVHNIWAERALGMMDSQCRRAPNATEGFVDSKVKCKLNATLDWLDKKDLDAQEAAVKFAAQQAVEERRREGQRQEEMEREIFKRMKEKEQKKETTDRNRLERQIRAAISSGTPVTSNLPIEVSGDKLSLAENMTTERWLVGKRLSHLWNVGDQLVKYHARVLKEAKKSRDLTISYSSESEVEDDSVDYKLKISDIIIDFLLGDLQLVD